MFSLSYTIYFIVYLDKKWDEEVSFLYFPKPLSLFFAYVSGRSHWICWFRGFKN